MTQRQQCGRGTSSRHVFSLPSRMARGVPCDIVRTVIPPPPPPLKTPLLKTMCVSNFASSRLLESRFGKNDAPKRKPRRDTNKRPNKQISWTSLRRAYDSSGVHYSSKLWKVRQKGMHPGGGINSAAAPIVCRGMCACMQLQGMRKDCCAHGMLGTLHASCAGCLMRGKSRYCEGKAIGHWPRVPWQR